MAYRWVTKIAYQQGACRGAHENGLFGLSRGVIQIARFRANDADVRATNAFGALLTIGCSFFMLARIFSNSGVCEPEQDRLRANFGALRLCFAEASAPFLI